MAPGAGGWASLEWEPYAQKKEEAAEDSRKEEDRRIGNEVILIPFTAIWIFIILFQGFAAPAEVVAAMTPGGKGWASLEWEPDALLSYYASCHYGVIDGGTAEATVKLEELLERYK